MVRQRAGSGIRAFRRLRRTECRDRERREVEASLQRGEQSRLKGWWFGVRVQAPMGALRGGVRGPSERLERKPQGGCQDAAKAAVQRGAQHRDVLRVGYLLALAKLKSECRDVGQGSGAEVAGGPGQSGLQ